MSRIDEALRVWEQSVGVARGDDAAIPRTGRTSISEYTLEGRAGDAHAAAAALEEAPAPVWATPRTVVADTKQALLDENAAARLVRTSSDPISVEQYRRLAATLHEVQVSKGLKTVMLTSALPHEGKTLTTLNLAFTLADSYERRVLLIDADLRAPCLHSLLGIGNARGLSEALSDEQLELPLTELSERLFVLTAGRVGTAPLAGLSSPRMGALLEECGRRFDWVLLDTPPVGVLPDAQLLAHLAGAVIFVIAAGSTPAAIVERAVAELGPECIVGTVLNRVDKNVISEAGYIDRYHSRE